jgi:UDP-N-acetylmuramate: L-alanyl-gamma-D-glutamyl-meso-diaminopimelate ligase
MSRGELHFIGACGKGMGAVAIALCRAGWTVTGSDESAYPPMSELMREHGVAVRMPYDPANIPRTAQLVVVGKRVRADNPELRQAIERGIEYCSFPQLLRRLFLHRSRNAVVAGGVGKTTTTAMLAWILEHAGQNPDYLIGGLARNLAAPARFGGAALAVLEGDEYASCFDDPQPKFMHYRAELAVITNILEDHPDLYPDIAAVADVFAKLARSLPPSGCLVVSDEDEYADRIVPACSCRATTVGFTARADYRIAGLHLSPSASRFRLADADFTLPLCGRMNVRNAAMAAVAAAHFGISWSRSAGALARFAGVRHRQESRSLGGYTVVMDKASHPAALRALFEAMRQQYPGRRLVSMIRPRATGGSAWVYQRSLPDALAQADRVIVLSAYEHDPEPGRVWAEGPFSTEGLLADLAEHGVASELIADARKLPLWLRREDVLVVSLPEQSAATLARLESGLAER